MLKITLFLQTTIFPLLVTKPPSNCAAFKHSCSKTEMLPGPPLPGATAPCLDTLSHAPSPHQFPCCPPTSASSSGPFSAPVDSQPHFLWSCQFTPLTPFSLCTSFCPSMGTMVHVFLICHFQKTSGPVCWN